MSRLKDPKLLLAVITIVALMAASRVLLPVPLPHIQLPAEAIPGIPVLHLPLVGDLVVSNTMVAILLTDALLIVLAFLATRRLSMVPSGLQNVFEAIIEYWENMSVQMIGEDLTRRYLPLFLTLFLLIALANWSELIPGYDTFGVLFQPEHHGLEHHTGPEAAAPAPEQEHTLFRVEWLGEPGSGFGIGMERLEEGAAGSQEAEAGTGGDHVSGGWAFVPFVRAASTDLSFTMALAVIAVAAIQVLGFQCLGPGYLKKFVHLDFSQGVGRGLMNIFVGLLELISEFARIVSFAFRLFGNIFAGQTLLFVLPFLLPFIAVVPVFGLELFVGMIQAFVFAILTLAFMAVAMIAHGGEGH